MDFERSDIASLVVWRRDVATDYSIEDVSRHGLDGIYRIVCDNYAEDCEIYLYDVDGDEIGYTTVGDLIAYLGVQ